MLFLATKRLCSLLIAGIHYSLLVIQFSSWIQISSGYTNISSRSLAYVNCKYASEEIYPVLIKQQSIKSSTTKSSCNCTTTCKVQETLQLLLLRNLLDEVNYRFKITVHKQLLKTLGTYLICQYNKSKKTLSVKFEGPLFNSHWCMNKHEHVHTVFSCKS